MIYVILHYEAAKFIVKPATLSTKDCCAILGQLPVTVACKTDTVSNQIELLPLEDFLLLFDWQQLDLPDLFRTMMELRMVSGA